MKKATFALMAIVFGISATCQSIKLSVKPDEITIPINTKVLVSSELSVTTIGNFKLIEHWPVSEPLNMMEVLGSIERVDFVSDQLELQFCRSQYQGKQYVVLATTNRFEKPMTFKAKLKYPGIEGYYETSISLKYPGVFSVEQWPNDIEAIVLYDFRLVDE